MVICDLGMAKKAEPSAAGGAAGQLMRFKTTGLGTRGYRAPEVHRLPKKRKGGGGGGKDANDEHAEGVPMPAPAIQLGRTRSGGYDGEKSDMWCVAQIAFMTQTLKLPFVEGHDQPSVSVGSIHELDPNPAQFWRTYDHRYRVRVGVEWSGASLVFILFFSIFRNEF